jgi:hypothetical protein
MGTSTTTGTLTAGQSRTFSLAPASAVVLTLSPNVRVTITETPATLSGSGLGGNATRVHEPRLPGTFTYGPYAMGGTIVVEVESTSGSSVAWSETSALLNSDDQLIAGDGALIALSEVTAYVTRTTTGTAHTGAGEFAGYICTVAAGNITVYDNTSAAGTVIVPTTALVVGAFPIFGAGTNGKLALTTGCHVVLSGAATVNVLVQ